jgi:ribosome maturation factor RimP
VSSNSEQAVRALVDELAAASGLDVVEVALKGQGNRQLLKVLVDRKGGLDLAACQELAKRLSERLDAADPVPGRYTLEVSSPGTGYPLRDQRAFDRVEGKRVTVLRAEAPEISGVVKAARDEVVVLDVEGEEVTVPYGAITKATQALPW